MKESKEFKEWLDQNYHSLMVKTIDINEEISNHLEYFEWLFPFEFKWGIYLKFFDEKGITIEVLSSWFSHNKKGLVPEGFYSEVNMLRVSKKHHKTRQEAQQEAIKKAFEILEKKD